MSTSTQVSELKINKLTKQQYDDITPSNTELYVVTTVGDSTTPVYINSSGIPTSLSYSLAKSVPSDAVFTDTTYSTFTGANGTDAGSSGLVPAPSATDNTKFLKGDGTWASVDGASTSGNNTFSGSNFFSGTVSLGSFATAITPSVDDNDMSVATTSFVRSLTTHQPISTVSYSSSQTIPLALGTSLYKLTPSGNITSMSFNTSNISAGNSVAYTFELCLVMTGSVYTIAWPSSLIWMDGITPDLSSTGTYFFAFRTINGGTTWLGNLQGVW